MKKRKIAIISVSDKTGIADFARGLMRLGYDIAATSGTVGFLAKMGVPSRDVSELTGFREMLDGRVKTLHPGVFAGILAEGPGHAGEIRRAGIAAVDLVAVNFYPFEEMSSRSSSEDAAEHIDVGGVAMLRAAAKNYSRVTAVSSSDDYPEVLDALKSGKNTLEFRRRLAARAFAASAYYDALIASKLAPAGGSLVSGAAGPHKTALPLKFSAALRYGENPHQPATFYVCPAVGGPRPPERLSGREVSYNNLLDVAAGASLAEELGGPVSCVIIKHTTPCGAASSPTSAAAWRMAFAADPLSAFGGVAVFNSKVDAAAASAITGIFTDAVAAPDYDVKALEILRKKKNLLILKTHRQAPILSFETRSALGGVLIQSPDPAAPEKMKFVTKKRPTPAQKKSLVFAMKTAKHSKSNAVALVSGTRVLGIGSGCVSRIDAMRSAVGKMKKNAVPPTDGIVMASDAFFPFDDIVKEASAAGVGAIIQPGGSIRDADSVRACDEAGIAMVFTGRRHFRH